MSILCARNILKIYYGRSGINNTYALNGINLEVDNNEFLGIMGPSGSGKTTLLNMLSGIDRATGGTVDIDGNNIYSMKDNELALFRRQKLGFVFQEYNLLDSLTIRENIILPMVLDRKYIEDIEERLNQISNVFEIKDILSKYPYMVSGGQQQRAAICRAIVNEPVLVFADEPTGSLDSKSSRVVMESFTKLKEIRNSTVVMVTHDAFAASYCDRIIFIRDGMVQGQLIRKNDRKSFFDDIIAQLSLECGK